MTMTGGMQGYTQGDAEYHRSTRYQEQVRQLDEQYKAEIEAPLRERIKELEDALASIASYLSDTATCNSDLAVASAAQAALKKVSSPEELRNEVTKKEKP